MFKCSASIKNKQVYNLSLTAFQKRNQMEFPFVISSTLKLALMGVRNQLTT